MQLGRWRRKFQVTEREACVSLVIDDFFSYRTPVRQQLAATLDIFLLQDKLVDSPRDPEVISPDLTKKQYISIQNYIVRTRC